MKYMLFGLSIIACFLLGFGMHLYISEIARMKGTIIFLVGFVLLISSAQSLITEKK